MSNTVIVSALPKCDGVGFSGRPSPCANQAHYDYRTAFGPWANGCRRHWMESRAYQELGTGKGQLLVAAPKPTS